MNEESEIYDEYEDDEVDEVEEDELDEEVEDVPMVEFRLSEVDENGVRQTKSHWVPESERVKFETEHGLN